MTAETSTKNAAGSAPKPVAASAVARRFVLAVLAVAAMTILPASPAHAHAALLSTDPVQGSIVQTAPEQVTLTFSEPVSPVTDKIRIIGPDGKRADTGEPVVEGAVLRIPLRDDPARGTYLVSFRVISADSHPVPGGFSFSIGEQSATPTEVPDEQADSTVTWLIGIAKYAGYAGLALLVGAVFVLALLWPARLDRRGPRRLLWTGFGLVTLATLAGLYLQAPYINGVGLFEVDGDDLAGVMSSQFGVALVVRLGVLAVAAFLIRPLIHGTGGKADQVLALGLGIVGVLTWPFSGHPAGSPTPPVSIVVDALHLSGVAVWLGGLTVLAAFLLRRADERELGAILPVWSRWAGFAVATVLLAGVISALIEVSTVSALVETTYGRFILLKLALVALLMGMASLARGAVNRGGHNIGAVVKTELAIAAVILGVTSALTQTTPARTAEAISQAPSAPQIFSATVESDLFRLQVEVDAATRGNNLVHLYAYTPVGNPLKVVEWKATVALPSAGVEPIEIPLLRINDNHVTGSINIPTPGDWVFKFTLRTTEIDQDSVTVTVPIK